MPLEFKRFNGRGVVLLHSAKHDPNELLDVIEGEPARVVGVTPPVRVYKFGRQELAVRDFRRDDGREDLLYAFDTLVGAAKSRAALVELPIALVSRAASDGRIVTLWKKGTRSLGEYLDDARVPQAAKRKACISAARKLAKLHAAGFIHGHPEPENFLVNRRSGNAHLVDYTFQHLNYAENADSRELESPAYYFGRMAEMFLRGHFKSDLVLNMLQEYDSVRARLTVRHR